MVVSCHYLVRPDFGNVEWIPTVSLCVLGLHDLDKDIPGREIAALNGLKQILSGIIGIGAFQFGSLIRLQVLDALLGLEVPFDVLELALLVYQLECMGAKAVHVAETVRSTVVGVEDGLLMDGLGREREEIPGSIGILEISTRIALLSVDKVRELGGITDKEDGRVVANNVEVALLSVELESKPTRITSSISAASLATDSGETSKHGRLFTNFTEELGLGEMRNVMGDLCN